jgi:hypothetical protein
MVGEERRGEEREDTKVEGEGMTRGTHVLVCELVSKELLIFKK